MSKICTRCKVEKEFEDFYETKTIKDGYSSKCKICTLEYNREYSKKNRDSVLKQKKKSYTKNKEKRLLKERIKYNKNKEKKLQLNKDWYYKNKESRSKTQKAYRVSEQGKRTMKLYREENRDKLNSKHREYTIQREKVDPVFKLRRQMATTVKTRLTKFNYTKKSKTFKIIRCLPKDLLKHLNNNPYGFNFADKGIDIDHIIPLSLADTEEELLKLCKFINLQLLPSEYNRYIKKDKPFDKEHFENWLEVNSEFTNLVE